MKLRALIACEYSGIVRTAFEQKGWDAVSCDLLPTEIPGNHYQGDVMDIINHGWDLMIAFPPCTYLTYAGMKDWQKIERVIKRIEAADFFMKLYCADISHICVENPRGIMYKIFRKPDQEIHPYYFGDNDMKRTGLWLKNLPKLIYHLQPDLFNPHVKPKKKPEPIEIQLCKKTNKMKKRYRSDSVSTKYFMNGHERSRFFPSVAKAMADQWTKYILNLQ